MVLGKHNPYFFLKLITLRFPTSLTAQWRFLPPHPSRYSIRGESITGKTCESEVGRWLVRCQGLNGDPPKMCPEPNAWCLSVDLMRKKMCLQMDLKTLTMEILLDYLDGSEA